MSERSQNLASEFQQVSDDLLSLVERCTDEQWNAITEAEGWTAAAVSHHVANGYLLHVRWAQTLVAGEPILPAPGPTNDERNAQHAIDFARADKLATVEQLRTNATQAATTIEALTDEQLDLNGSFMTRPISVQQLVERVFIGHPRGHSVGIRALLDDR